MSDWCIPKKANPLSVMLIWGHCPPPPRSSLADQSNCFVSYLEWQSSGEPLVLGRTKWMSFSTNRKGVAQATRQRKVTKTRFHFSSRHKNGDDRSGGLKVEWQECLPLCCFGQSIKTIPPLGKWEGGGQRKWTGGVQKGLTELKGRERWMSKREARLWQRQVRVRIGYQLLQRMFFYAVRPIWQQF